MPASTSQPAINPGVDSTPSARSEPLRNRGGLQDLRGELPRPEQLRRIQEEAQALIAGVFAAGFNRRA